MYTQYSQQEKYVFDIPCERSFIRVWRDDDAMTVEEIQTALQPLLQTGCIDPYIAVMPDYHPAPGFLNGVVLPSADSIFPEIIGGDIGCGVSAMPLPLREDRIKNRLEKIYSAMLKTVPKGKEFNRAPSERIRMNPIWDEISVLPMMTERIRKKLLHQFGTLGGGNHFLEIQADSGGAVWIMLHTGSRYLGQAVQDYYLRQSPPNSERARKTNCVLRLAASSETARNYLRDVAAASRFARLSRLEIMERMHEIFCSFFPQNQTLLDMDVPNSLIDVAHNTIVEEQQEGLTLFVHRKGAIPAQKGMLGVVPGSMGTPSFIVEGRGNPASFCSCSHGAGRAISRKEACKKISFRTMQKSMQGILYSENRRLLDEAPQAYKNIRRVMRAQGDLVKIIDELNPIAVMKGES